MVLAKSKNAVGLGNSLMKDRFGKEKGSDHKKATATGVQRINHATGETYITNEKKEASWVKMKSVTEQAALDEFLSTAELAGTDFTAEKLSHIKIIQADQKNPYLLSTMEERDMVGKHKAFKNRLTVPRRPQWDSSTTPEQLDSMERDSLLEWRRGLAELQENYDLLLTPFERNLEVWRQLWRVIERSDLVVQIVDARNPLLFRSEDLERYVKETNHLKRNLLLINKADMLSQKQRQAWADYFQEAGIEYKFFSASLAKEMNEAHQSNLKSINSCCEGLVKKTMKLNMDGGIQRINEKIQDYDGAATQILTAYEVEALFLQNAPKNSGNDPKSPIKIQIGLVGYPNVGKSSTINALIGAKKVSVSSTPGKTKHFQTIHLSDEVLLCDCPGLVFPNFATTKAELVCNGILPIDQLREFSGPAGIVAKLIPQSYLETIYGIKIKTRPIEEGGTGIPTAEELLTAYAKSRGFTRSGQGQPDESRAARYILKDFVKGKLLYCHPPPTSLDPITFNFEQYTTENVCEIKKSGASLDDSSTINKFSPQEKKSFSQVGIKSQKLDNVFFASEQGNLAHLKMPFSHKYTQQSQVYGQIMFNRKQNASFAMEKEIDQNNGTIMISKKHFKNGKRSKNKRRPNYFED